MKTITNFVCMIGFTFSVMASADLAIQECNDCHAENFLNALMDTWNFSSKTIRRGPEFMHEDLFALWERILSQVSPSDAAWLCRCYQIAQECLSTALYDSPYTEKKHHYKAFKKECIKPVDRALKSSERVAEVCMLRKELWLLFSYILQSVTTDMVREFHGALQNRANQY
jgi:hypothetical protein